MPSAPTQGIGKVIAAASVGTLIEWYDFYIFGSLATVIASQFFPKTDPGAALLSTLGTFAAGFMVRPFGALVFGRLGDLIGRKYTFMITLVIMGVSTFAMGLVPRYETIGFAAPLIVLLLRLLQGLALGGEYGGAAIYVAEHSPENKRGFFTSWIQTTGTLGLFLSLGVILIVRRVLDSDPARSIAKFNDWGWRIPFLISALLVVISVYIRIRMKESPVFTRIKEEGKISAHPLKESFTRKENLKVVLVALFGAAMGQGVVWYTMQFYAQSFIENVCKIDFDQSRTILIWAILFGTPFFVVFGSLSDRVGRKWLMISGMLLAVLTSRFIFSQLLSIADRKNKTELVEKKVIQSSLSVIGSTAEAVRTSVTESSYDDGTVETETKKDTVYQQGAKTSASPEIRITRRLGNIGYWEMIGLVFIMIIYTTMVYGPIAAFLVDLFPAKIRYSSLSLPYHIGNGVFGGLTPFIATLLTTIYTTDKLVGLSYLTVTGSICIIVCALYVHTKYDQSIHEN